MARGGSSGSGNNTRHTHGHTHGHTHARRTSTHAHSTSTHAPTSTPQNKLYKTASDLSNIMVPSAIILYLMAASRRKKNLEEESQTKHHTSAELPENELPENELPEKLPEDDKCKIQYSNMLDCLKNNQESQCKQFIKSMEECVNEV